MSAVLRPMTDDEFAEWLPRMRDAYGDDMIENGGLAPEKARAKAIADVERLFPGEQQNDGQLVYAIEADGEAVGELWLSERDDEVLRCIFIFDIHVDERHRGRGYAKDALRFTEDEARRRGHDRIALNVFGGNDVARGLYRSLGYEENAVAMSKRL